MATAAAGAEAPQGGGKKKLIIILAVVLVLVLGGAVAVLLLKKKAPVEGEEGEAAEHAPAPVMHKPPPGTPPVYVPLDPFTVNLTDKEVDRFAQIGITLEVMDAKTADTIKAYLPAIRSNVLMLISHKSASELLTVEGKEKLAREIMRESVRPMGIELDDDEDEATDAPKKKKKKRRAQVVSPVTNVLFSNFIVQ